MVSIGGLIEFDANNVADGINLFANKIDDEISLDIYLKRGYDKKKIRELLRQHPIWRKTALIPHFEKEAKSEMITVTFQNTDFSVETMIKIIKEINDKVLPILDEIEPLVRMGECTHCGHSWDVK